MAGVKFQSSSSPKAGCNVRKQPSPALADFMVSILIQPEGRMQPGDRGRRRQPLHAVSILIQPEGRMQLPECVQLIHHISAGFNPHPARRPDATMATLRIPDNCSCWFQSSSSPKAGCNPARPPADRCPWTGFNPHPARRPDATAGHLLAVAPAVQVSILIQPEGRMQQPSMAVSRRILSQFQSSSSPKAGCNCLWSVRRACRACFNPHPARRPDTTAAQYDVAHDFVFQSSSSPKAGCNPRWVSTTAHCSVVSILIQPEGRMQQMSKYARITTAWGFNPHPARRPDATKGFYGARPPHAGFNPHPARRPDATPPRPARWHCDYGFNPHPARRPDATADSSNNIFRTTLFQSSSSPKAGCNKSTSYDSCAECSFQSSSSPKAGCNTPAPPKARHGWACFNPHPARRPDATCTPMATTIALGVGLVSILIQPEGRMQPPSETGPYISS